MPCSDERASFTENDLPDLSGYVILITGGHAGVGYETTYQLAIRGARIYLGGRSETRVNEGIQKMNEAAGLKLDLHFLKIDLENLSSLKAAAKVFGEYEACLDLLINNAGIMNVAYELTVDGFERQWQVNYVAPHVMDQLFLPYLMTAASIHEQQDRVRVIHVSSGLARLGPSTIQLGDPNMPSAKGPMAPRTRYSHAKQATIRDVWEFNRRYSEKGVTAYSLHPGLIRTGLQDTDQTFMGNISRTIVGIGGSTALEGCRNTLFCATSMQAPATGQGKFFMPVGKIYASADKWFSDEKANAALWEHGQAQVRRLGAM